MAAFLFFDDHDTGGLGHTRWENARRLGHFTIVSGVPEHADRKEKRKTTEKCAEAVDFNMLKS
ncbi:MAG: hypothetical protein PUE91_00235 [Clostridiales bacterium]|nr:hypothetical protein [Clostridiales bacterium]